MFSVLLFAQTDSIRISAHFSSDLKTVQVQQTIRLNNRGKQDLDSLKLVNWIAAYAGATTPLAKRKLEDRNSDMHFAKSNDFGFLQNLSITVDHVVYEVTKLSDENIYIPLSQPLPVNQSANIELNYTLVLPNKKFTDYGVGENSAFLKYFFIVPDHYYPMQKRNYLDIEETVNTTTYWDIQLFTTETKFINSNLAAIDKYHFAGFANTDPEIRISTEETTTMNFTIGKKNCTVTLGYTPNLYEQSRLLVVLPKQLQFIHDKLGQLPNTIFISEKFKNKENFFGNDDIVFWKFRFPLFTPGDQIDMDYLSVLSQKIANELVVVDKEKHHWLKKGLKTYLETQYLKTYFPESKLLGHLPDSFHIFGLKPLKWFNASNLKLTERYGLAYQYMVSQNLDQAIASPFSQLSNFNQMVISDFEMGSLFNFVAEKMKPQYFDDFLKSYLQKNSVIQDSQDFLNQLSIQSHFTSDFITPYTKDKQRVNFKIHNFKRKDHQLWVDISKKTDLAVPFRLETISNKNPQQKRQYWFETQAKENREIYIVPDSAVSKITLNSDYIFPENNSRDNYLYTQGLFSNFKKLKFKLLKDVPNPEYHEVYLNPKMSFNIYDQVLLGLNFSNSSFFAQPFLYSITPYYSTGTGQFTGSGAVSYSVLPANSFFNTLSFGLSGSFFHYAPSLSYRKFSAATSMLFSKNPRSSISRSVFMSFNQFQKDLDPLMVLNNDYEKYHIWSMGYGFSDRKLIHEKAFGVSLQAMDDYQKITSEALYRWEYASKKKISFRVFAGVFIENNTRNNFFDFGISKVSNYSFSYGLFGQGTADGFWSQQFVLADGGFKSMIPNTANQWIGSANIDAHAWKMFNLYADFGWFKNKGFSPQFIWDTGVKLKIVPDFVELYFPIQSSLGFEPGFQDYGKRIRFTLTFDLNSIINTARRGWF